MQKVYKLAHQATASTNAAASVTIARRGTLTGIGFCVFLNSGAAVSSMANEVSFGNTQQVATNDTIGPLACVQHALAASTVGSTQQHVPCNIAVNAGDRIYLNTLVTGTIAASYIQVFLYVNE